MKRHLLIMVALLLAAFSQAQVFKLAPRSESVSNHSSGIVKEAFTRADGQLWWGYFVGNEYIDYLGTGRAETFDCAIYVPANHDLVGASSIKAIRFYLGNASNVSMAKVWISKSLPTSVDNADYVQNVSVSSLVDGANDIVLKTPYAVNNAAIYVGYSFTIKSAEYCIAMGGEYIDNSLYIRSSNTGTSWGAVTIYGKLALQLLLEGGNYPANSATPSDFDPFVVELGQSVSVPLEIVNGGTETITNISYTITTNGVVSGEKSVNIPNTPYNASAVVNIPFEADAVEGTTEKILTVTKVNGKANTASKKAAKGKMTTVANLKVWPRTVLIEEFTTEYCGYCPQAAAGLASFMSTYPDLANQVAIVCHHSGYYTDWLTIDASERYTWFYNDGGRVYAPAFMYDRYAWDGKTAVESRQGNAEGYKSRVEARMSDSSNANIDLKANFNADKSAINVVANCERGWDFSSTPARITLFLTEDNIMAHSQSGASGTFIHQHVLRAVNETWGSVINWSGNKATYTYKFNLDPSWKTDNLKVVAMISAYDQSDATKCEVENAAKTSIDPAVEVVDLNTLVQYIMTGRYDSKADLNHDNKVNAADLVLLINMVP
jgi:hypothetical protein